MRYTTVWGLHLESGVQDEALGKGMMHVHMMDEVWWSFASAK